METQELLLQECRDKEVWAIPYGNSQQGLTDITTIPSYKTVVEGLDWCKCKQEYELNYSLYGKDTKTFSWKSGSDEQHTACHDFMDEITTLNADQISVNAPETSEQVENDLKCAGEAIRNGQLEVHKASPHKKG